MCSGKKQSIMLEIGNMVPTIMLHEPESRPLYPGFIYNLGNASHITISIASYGIKDTKISIPEDSDTLVFTSIPGEMKIRLFAKKFLDFLLLATLELDEKEIINQQGNNITTY